MNTRMTRIGIAVNWSRLRDLMKEYLDGHKGDDELVLRQIALSDFLIWLGHQQRQPRGKQPTTTTNRSE